MGNFYSLPSIDFDSNALNYINTSSPALIELEFGWSPKGTFYYPPGNNIFPPAVIGISDDDAGGPFSCGSLTHPTQRFPPPVTLTCDLPRSAISPSSHTMTILAYTSSTSTLALASSLLFVVTDDASDLSTTTATYYTPTATYTSTATSTVTAYNDVTGLTTTTKTVKPSPITTVTTTQTTTNKPARPSAVTSTVTSTITRTKTVTTCKKGATLGPELDARQFVSTSVTGSASPIADNAIFTTLGYGSNAPTTTTTTHQPTTVQTKTTTRTTTLGNGQTTLTTFKTVGKTTTPTPVTHTKTVHVQTVTTAYPITCTTPS